MTGVLQGDCARNNRARWSLAVWLPLCYAVVAEPALDVGSARPAWLALGSLLLVVATFSAAVILATRRFWVQPPADGGRDHLLAGELLLGVQAAVTLASTVAFGQHWLPLFTLLAIGVGVVGPPRRAPYVLVLVTTVATVLASAEATWGRAWTVALTTFLAGFGTYAFHRLFAVIAELARTREELARIAVSEERARFSRDLHDLLGHTLSVIVVKAEAVRRLAPRDTGAVVEHATDIEAIGRQALDEVRQAVTGYRGASLAQELDRARTACEAASIALSVAVDDTTLTPSAEAVLGWTVREGVTNVLRHAHASRCSIEVRRSDDGIRLTIDDDGDGRAAASPDGAGLRGLRERVTGSGGRVDAADTGGGFRVTVDLPLDTVGVSVGEAAAGRAGVS